MSDTITIKQCFCGKCNIESPNLIPWLITWNQDGKTWNYANQSDVQKDNLSEFLDEKLFNRECLIRDGQLDG